MLYYQLTHSVTGEQPLPAWTPRSAHLSLQGISQFHPPSGLRDGLGQGQRALRTPVSSTQFQATTTPLQRPTAVSPVFSLQLSAKAQWPSVPQETRGVILSGACSYSEHLPTTAPPSRPGAPSPLPAPTCLELPPHLTFLRHCPGCSDVWPCHRIKNVFHKSGTGLHSQ